MMRIVRCFSLMMTLLLLIMPQTTHAKDNTLLWGDTHTHSSYSFDAFLSANMTADPDTAYRFAKGEPVLHPLHRARVQLARPLDFLVVADHAEGLGVMDILYYGRHGIKETSGVFDLREAVDSGKAIEFFTRILPQIFPSGSFETDNPVELGDINTVIAHGWHDSVEMADKHNQPGKFTTFVGWEWSAYENGGNMHRVVFSPIDANQAKTFMPYGADKSNNPIDLWHFLDDLNKKNGFDFIAIPHNSNVSKNHMFPESLNELGEDAYVWSKLRRRYEPVVEITQYKGDSETHPLLSPNDEFAHFSPFPFYIAKVTPEPYEPGPGDFVRSGLLSGLKIRQSLGINPYEFGVIGSTDSHTGLSTAEETEFAGKMAMDGIPESKAVMYSEDSFNGWDMSAAGMAAVWAEDNTREAIFAAFKRKEIYATTGPRMTLWVYGGQRFEPSDLQGNVANIGKLKGVPMGGMILGINGQNSPISLLIHAEKDPLNANLDRVQVVKGWIDTKGNKKEKVFNVAWDKTVRTIRADGSLPGVGNTVSLSTGKVDNTIGAPSFTTLWTDPQFELSQDAFYYVRVLQIPTVHHSWLDALALGKDSIQRQPKTIQERAYSSPIWYYAK